MLHIFKCQYTLIQLKFKDAIVFKIFLVQPLSHHPDNDDKNVADAVNHIKRAAKNGF